MNGRFAPSPTGPLHVGNLRTALVAWLAARTSGRGFLLRMEDLDRVTSSLEHEATQQAALRALGLDWDEPVIRQSDRFDAHYEVIGQLVDAGHTYRCYCTRKEIAEAATAPHAAGPLYPGTCRNLTAAQIAEREAEGRPAAIRLRVDQDEWEFVDELAGPFRGGADDIVLQRNDGVPAYNLAVVVDDHAAQVDQVVRGDDLLTATPGQLALLDRLGWPAPEYVHVPLVLGPDGDRLAKRHGAACDGAGVLPMIAASLGLAEPDEPVTLAQLVERFNLDLLPRSSWRMTSEQIAQLSPEQ